MSINNETLKETANPCKKVLECWEFIMPEMTSVNYFWNTAGK